MAVSTKNSFVMSIISCFHPIHHLSSFKSSKCHKLIEFDFSLPVFARRMDRKRSISKISVFLIKSLNLKPLLCQTIKYGRYRVQKSIKFVKN